jgi:hypothetical protein
MGKAALSFGTLNFCHLNEQALPFNTIELGANLWLGANSSSIRIDDDVIQVYDRFKYLIRDYATHLFKFDISFANDCSFSALLNANDDTVIRDSENFLGRIEAEGFISSENTPISEDVEIFANGWRVSVIEDVPKISKGQYLFLSPKAPIWRISLEDACLKGAFSKKGEFLFSFVIRLK